jgi:hypothetical protein
MTQSMSIYIPHVFTNITKEFIMKTFENWQIGKVHHVDFTDKIDKKGKINDTFISTTNPQSEKVVKKIEELINN